MQKNSPKYTNRLHLETSPYLLQHAHNPVDWYPWGNEAFDAAQKSGQPILLSIGYSTCHWCHVMEEESFEDEEIAAFMNANYVSIKVDREERPDIDAIYMSAVQATTGRGGWPMTIWLTADKKPFYAGTYFPPRAGARGAQFGFLEVLKHLRQKFDEDPASIAHHANEIALAVKNDLESSHESSPIPTKMLEQAVELYKARFDPDNGGIAGQPKFPSSFPVRLLLRWFSQHPDPTLLEMITTTLRCMARGGIYDHVAGGFHRYSTDGQWLVPHFEKMLYDNALLARAYVEASVATGDAEFADVAKEIFKYVERDMTSPDGAFFSATDADSLVPSGKKEEGYFFTWTLAELKQILTEDEFEFAKSFYNLSETGSFEGRNILFVDKDTPGSQFVIPANAGIQTSTVKQKLYAARAKRPQPSRDEKILAAWNALMISALAKAAYAFDDAVYLERATRAARFIFDNMFSDGQLFRVHKDTKAKQPAFLDDYAFLIAACLDLYESTSDAEWLNRTIELDQILHAHFEDKENGAFFMTGNAHETLIAREKPSYDGAEPSGNSVQCLNLLRLNQLTSQDSYRERADKCLRALSSALTRNPMALSELLIALDLRQSRMRELIIVTPKGEKDSAKPFLNRLRQQFLPHAVTLVLSEEEIAANKKLVPALEGKSAIGQKATLYACENGLCQLPISDVGQLPFVLGL